MKDEIVVAVVPVYNPPSGLDEHLRELSKQVADVIVVDDGSNPPFSSEVATVITCGTNAGIAAALNRGIRAAEDLRPTQILTVDQDTVLPSGYVEELLLSRQRAISGGLRPAVMGAAGYSGMVQRGRWRNGVMVVEESIQSGAMFDLEALRSIGGMDEELVIDAVDTDACLRLADAGWDICVAPVEIEHVLGAGHFVHLFGRAVWASGHPPFRRYYITRNGLITLKRHGRRHPQWAFVYARKLVVSSMLAVRDREQRAAMVAGVRDAWRSRMGKTVRHRSG